jgi:tRNA(adenine34) deaminase
MTEDPASDERFMRQALAEAARTAESGDVPIGCVIVRDGRVIGRGCNQRELLQDPTAHAEILAITAAAAEAGSWRLERCTMYVTLEPCPMCAGAIVQARIPRLVFAAPDPKAGACGSLMDIVRDPRLNHRVELLGGVLAEECGDRLRSFFKALRG